MPRVQPGWEGLLQDRVLLLALGLFIILASALASTICSPAFPCSSHKQRLTGQLQLPCIPQFLGNVGWGRTRKDCVRTEQFCLHYMYQITLKQAGACACTIALPDLAVEMYTWQFHLAATSVLCTLKGSRGTPVENCWLGFSCSGHSFYHHVLFFPNRKTVKDV